MADNDDQEKTEEPTQKKLDDALKRGDVAKSQEVSTWFVLAGGTLAAERRRLASCADASGIFVQGFQDQRALDDDRVAASAPWRMVRHGRRAAHRRRRRQPQLRHCADRRVSVIGEPRALATGVRRDER